MARVAGSLPGWNRREHGLHSDLGQPRRDLALRVSRHRQPVACPSRFHRRVRQRHGHSRGAFHAQQIARQPHPRLRRFNLRELQPHDVITAEIRVVLQAADHTGCHRTGGKAETPARAYSSFHAPTHGRIGADGSRQRYGDLASSRQRGLGLLRSGTCWRRFGGRGPEAQGAPAWYARQLLKVIRFRFSSPFRSRVCTSRWPAAVPRARRSAPAHKRSRSPLRRSPGRAKSRRPGFPGAAGRASPGRPRRSFSPPPCRPPARGDDVAAHRERHPIVVTGHTAAVHNLFAVPGDQRLIVQKDRLQMQGEEAVSNHAAADKPQEVGLPVRVARRSEHLPVAGKKDIQPHRIERPQLAPGGALCRRSIDSRQAQSGSPSTASRTRARTRASSRTSGGRSCAASAAATRTAASPGV